MEAGEQLPLRRRDEVCSGHRESSQGLAGQAESPRQEHAEEKEGRVTPRRSALRGRSDRAAGSYLYQASAKGRQWPA